MNNQLDFQNLFHDIRENPTLAQQDISTDQIVSGMLCRTAKFEEQPEVFYLVTEVNGDSCEVIPGSLDGIMAGPRDIVLPENVLGNYVFLSLGLAATLPVDALGKGFAVLDDNTYNRIIDSQIKFETGENGTMPSFPFGMPYVSDHEERLAYHDIIREIVQQAQEPIFVAAFKPLESLKEWFTLNFTGLFDEQECALAAGTEQKNPSAECRFDDLAGTADLEYSIPEKTLFVNFYDTDGNVDTVHFEGWHITDENGAFLGKVENGAVIVRCLEKFSGKYCLTDLDGVPHAFRKIEG